jgi:hypothetical protein
MLLDDNTKRYVLLEYVIYNVLSDKTFKNALISISKKECKTHSDCLENELCTNDICINKNKFTKENKVVQISKKIGKLDVDISIKDKDDILGIKQVEKKYMNNIRDKISTKSSSRTKKYYNDVFQRVVDSVWDRTNSAIRRELGSQIYSLVSEVTQYELKKHK